MEPDPSPISAGIFEAVDWRLPTSIGLIVMHATILEQLVAMMAMSVQDLPQDHYFAQDVSRNLKVCRRRFKYFQEDWQKTAVAKALLFLGRADEMLAERHGVVHRVWAVTLGEVWGGHKPARSADLVDEEYIERGWNYTPERVQTIIDDLAAVVLEGRSIVHDILSFPRLPTPFADGIWPASLKDRPARAADH
jgi:hypothetical protein